MVPWHRLTSDVQKVILALMVAYGGAATTACLPRVCDPPPPPATTPRPSPTAFRTPMICDPPPPPPRTATATATAFRTPMICDPPPPPRTPTATGTLTPTVTSTVTPVICYPVLPSATPKASGATAQDARSSGFPLILPLAEIRSVDIVWAGGLSFKAQTPWQGARYRWSVSGGTLRQTGDEVDWQPPVAEGRYLLQVAADWGQDGLAVDAAVLVVTADGSLALG